MKQFITLLACLLLSSQLYSQTMLEGRVLSIQNNTPISNVTITLINQGTRTISKADGSFSITINAKGDSLKFSCVGFNPYIISASSSQTTPLVIKMTPDPNVLQEVILETGYQSLSRERAAGSFTHIDNSMLSRSVSPDILSKLEGISNGLSFSRRTILNEASQPPTFQVRGISTIKSHSTPLIVLDNFPYEGNIENINPNDIESVTILKDAAASSIWGAKSGNGVIVINTIKGKYNQKTAVNFSLNTTWIEKPDLFYNPRFLPSEVIMNIEEEQFIKGIFPEQNQTPLPEYVELLIAKKAEKISNDDFLLQTELLKNQDIREEAGKYLYRNGSNQQYALSFSGGGNRYTYFVSGGFDSQSAIIKSNNSQRLTLNLKNVFKPTESLELGIGLYLHQLKTEDNGLSLVSLKTTGFNLSPYTRLINSAGEPNDIVYRYRLPFVRNAASLGLLDWTFRPLDEIESSDLSNTQSGTKLDGSLKYTLLKGLDLNLLYQFQSSTYSTRSYYGEETFYTRDQINRYTQKDGKKIIPKGSILQGSNSSENYHFGRFQANYAETFHAHRITALAGAEIRQNTRTSQPGYLLYGYSDENLSATTTFNYEQFYPLQPSGSGRVGAPPSRTTFLIDRFLSYYLNGSYEYNKRYLLSFSSRWDGSNLFGVKTNQKGVPLWSIGGIWNLHQERFYTLNWLPYLRTRLTYGYNGNVNNSVSSMPIVSYAENLSTRLRHATLESTGNPGLRWERIKTINIGLDFSSKNNRIRGSLDYYTKNSSDLIGENIIDPTSGISAVNGIYDIDNRINYAKLESKGWDLELSTKNISGILAWESTFLLNQNKNKVLKYYTNESTTILDFLSDFGDAPPQEGQPLDALYSLPWEGLDSQTGAPIVYINGEISTNYSDYLNELKKVDLLNEGTRNPILFGSLRNTLTWKNLSASFIISWKSGYKFRRSSINYSFLYSERQGHLDYLNRWEKRGDELLTQVPSSPEIVNASRDNVFLLSKQLIESGNHIRLQDVNVSYLLNMKKIGVSNVRVFTYLRNLGILWRKNKHGLDPDFPLASYPAPLTISIGLQAKF